MRRVPRMTLTGFLFAVAFVVGAPILLVGMYLDDHQHSPYYVSWVHEGEPCDDDGLLLDEAMGVRLGCIDEDAVIPDETNSYSGSGAFTEAEADDVAALAADLIARNGGTPNGVVRAAVDRRCAEIGRRHGYSARPTLTPSLVMAAGLVAGSIPCVFAFRRLTRRARTVVVAHDARGLRPP